MRAFRDDLLHRLAIVVVCLPPMGERGDDDGLPLDRLLERTNKESEGEQGYAAKIFPVAARKLLIQHPWPGNVLGMLNALRRAALWTPGAAIDPEDARDALLPHRVREATPDRTLVQDIAHSIDIKSLFSGVARHRPAQAMAVSGGNKTRAARVSGFGNPTTLSNWLRRHEIDSRWHAFCV